MIGCPLHGSGVSPGYLVGRRLERLVASWHRHGTDPRSGPLDVWLIDSASVATHVTMGSDWCLILERSDPFPGYDMGDSGRVEVGPVSTETPFAAHLGETIEAVNQAAEPGIGRTVLDVVFESGCVRCDGWSGDLRLTAR